MHVANILKTTDLRAVFIHMLWVGKSSTRKGANVLSADGQTPSRVAF